MKLLTKEEENAHYAQVLKSGAVGGSLGLIGGLAGTMAAARRFSLIRNLTLPMKSFLVSSSATVGGILGADRGSRYFETMNNSAKREYQEHEEKLREEYAATTSRAQRLWNWCMEERYSIVGATWIASMLGSWVLVSRNKYLTSSQKIVQARVYAQGLTLAVLVASAAFEIADQRKAQSIADQAREKARKTGKKVEEVMPSGAAQAHHHQDEGQDMWKEIVAAEEQRLKEVEERKHEREEAEKQQQQQQQHEGQGQMQAAKQ